ncbi:ubiquitin carboxyl-terminal hydrolase 3 [Halyomorpha halys]|uniref:ubiquitin carboxyl-terminal hydrolase 3 n=1 Tax=Halyomorpha halys TaxID=286706 RepID=UPI0006D4D03E|nr:ubiquitin carboxyl-terminal hydrolase 3-like [Halyomorpha halys]XP_014292504.1 ubiquitin carboxyl-terminal hydrolase 3-like [Halyomorpha halys]
MECPHVNENVKIEAPITQKDTKEWLCAECSSTQQPWMCLYCGVVHCGRYVNRHALEHWEKQGNHSLCLDCVNLTVYCYCCQEYVGNDTVSGLINQLRGALLSWNGESDSKIANDSWQPTTNIQQTRNLRPRTRKRSHSNDSSSTGSSENIQCKTRGKTRRKGEHDNNHRKTQKREKLQKRVVGLRNLGNTCFMNAVLQSLSNIEEFCLYFKKLPSLEGIKGRNKVYQSRSIKELKDAIMAEELRKILINLTDQGAKGAISPESLFLVIWKVVPRYRGYQQQDAHEFLRYMLDRLHTELLHLLPDFTLKDFSHKNKTSIVTSVFGGTLQSEVRCLNCGTESKKHDPFLDLSLDIPEKCINQRKCKDNAEDTPPCNILDCLTSFIEVEELAETELYYCSNCKSKQRSTKRFWIRRLPNVLCLHLKRFRWNNFFRTKVDTHISFPVIALDMSQFVLSDLPDTRSSGTHLYDLAAVIVHHGGGSGCGHYTAFAIHDGQWFHFNDSMVRPTEIDVVAKCKPYILFYIRREFRLPSVKS